MPTKDVTLMREQGERVVMSYISISFFVFVIIAWIVFRIFPAERRWIVLLSASLLFYGMFSPLYLLFLLYTALTTFFAGRLLEKKKEWKKRILVITLILNVAVWIFVKYYPYAASMVNRLSPAIVLPVFENLLIPVGISYYTLQSAGYLIDIYRGEAAEKNFFRYVLFLVWFPAIVQGPIARYHQLAPQFRKGSSPDFDEVRERLLLILYGIIKKLVIADRLAVIANYAFENYAELGFFQLYLGALAYSFQLYMDFSGCVDLCRGVSGLFGITLPANFDSPYFARSISRFWRKWHISLSSWLRDYIYFPLGGSRKGLSRKCWNILIVFLVSGFWHGAGVHFLLWGLLHGLYQVIGIATASVRKKIKRALNIQPDSSSDKIYQTVITFHLVAFAWIFFRADGGIQAFQYIRQMLTSWDPWTLCDGSFYTMGLSKNMFIIVVINLAAVMFADYLHEKNIAGLRTRICRMHIVIRWLIYFVLIYDILLFGAYGTGVSETAFLYGEF